jgi:hypothetical protein
MLEMTRSEWTDRVEEIRKKFEEKLRVRDSLRGAAGFALAWTAEAAVPT